MNSDILKTADDAGQRTYDENPEDRELGPTVLILDDDPLALERLELLCEPLCASESLQIMNVPSHLTGPT